MRSAPGMPALGLNVQPGEEGELDMPHFNGRAYDFQITAITDIKTQNKDPEIYPGPFTDINASAR